MKDFTNPVIKAAVLGARPFHDNACAFCLHAMWFRDMHSADLHCFCKLCAVESWNTRRGPHCVHLGVGRDAPVKKLLTSDESKNSVCVMCKDAVWWRDEGRTCFCYCKQLFRMTAGYSKGGHYIDPKMDCNGVRPMDDTKKGD